MPDKSVSSIASKILPLGKMQANLLLSSLIRDFRIRTTQSYTP